MNLFLDNDAQVKLASWNLLNDGIMACGFQPSEVRYLPTAPFSLGIRGAQQTKYPLIVLERLRGLLAAGQACVPEPASQDIGLVEVSGIDAGEAVLLSHAARTTGSLLLTGDKRCLRAVAGAHACAGIRQMLAGRVLCIEQVLLRAVDNLGFEEVRERVVGSTLLHFDTAVRSAFGSGMQATESNACGSLESRVKDLAREVSGLLVDQQYRFLDDSGP